MQGVISRSGPQRWLVAVLLGFVVPLLFATLPGAPARMVIRDAGLARDVHAEIAALNVLRIGFPRARAAERDTAIFSIRRALEATRNQPGEPVRAVRAAIETYVQALMAAPGSGIVPAAWPDNPAAATIDATLSQLQIPDEAMLREPFVGMRLAELALLSAADPGAARQLSRSAEIFAARLDEVTIPDGTRANLSRLLAAYQHDVLGGNAATAAARRDGDTQAAAFRAVETAIADADHVLTAEQQRVADAFRLARQRLWLLLGAAGLTSLLLAIGGGFTLGLSASSGRGLVPHSPIH